MFSLSKSHLPSHLIFTKILEGENWPYYYIPPLRELMYTEPKTAFFRVTQLVSGQAVTKPQVSSQSSLEQNYFCSSSWTSNSSLSEF